MDKVVLITGASSGIGAGTAKVLAAAAATVVLGARRADRLADLVTEIEHAGGTARAAEMDVRDSAQVAAFVAGAQGVRAGGRDRQQRGDHAAIAAGRTENG